MMNNDDDKSNRQPASSMAEVLWVDAVNPTLLTPLCAFEGHHSRTFSDQS